MSFEEAVEYALAITAPTDPMPRHDVRPGRSDADSDHRARCRAALTPREREVAALIVQGRTNREIAEALVLSERTVDSHVRNIMGKLEINSRAQIAGLGRPAPGWLRDVDASTDTHESLQDHQAAG